MDVPVETVVGVEDAEDQAAEGAGEGQVQGHVVGVVLLHQLFGEGEVEDGGDGGAEGDGVPQQDVLVAVHLLGVLVEEGDDASEQRNAGAGQLQAVHGLAGHQLQEDYQGGSQPTQNEHVRHDRVLTRPDKAVAVAKHACARDQEIKQVLESE